MNDALKRKTGPNKRKNTSVDPSSSKKQCTDPSIRSFFPPQIATSNDLKQSLSAEQANVLHMVVEEGKNVFFTGAAGTGKSLLLRAIIAALSRKYPDTPDAVSVTASTGMAASNIGGMTIHAWGAVAPGTQDVDTLISYIKKCKPAWERWKKTKVLVIDEVSMVDGYLFDRLAGIADRLRRTTNKAKLPFGGIQLVITGDFFQLPPVTKGPAYFAFESPAWQTCIPRGNIVNLKQVFRQKDDRFISLLNELRHGTISQEAITIFKSLSRPLGSPPAAPVPLPTPPPSRPASLGPGIAGLPAFARRRTLTPSTGTNSPSSSASTPPSTPTTATIQPTELFPLRREVDASNASRLASLRTPLFTFISKDSECKSKTEHAGGKKQSQSLEVLLSSIPAPPKLNLKVGAQVMLVKNLDSETDTGVTPGASKDKPASTAKHADKGAGDSKSFYEKKEASVYKQKKVVRTKARLVNGSVGVVIGFWKIGDLLGIGGGVAGEAVRCVQMGPSGPIRAVEDKENEEDVKKTSKGKGKAKDEELYPLVAFPILEGGSEVGKETVLLVREEFRVEDNDGNLLARRMQVPLILAWAMSIHKAQGQTIHKVKVDLGKVFEKGQSYVALSRASSLEGLQVLRFDPKKVMAHPKVIEWNNALEKERDITTSETGSSAT